jgi:hypothetical protein
MGRQMIDTNSMAQSGCLRAAPALLCLGYPMAISGIWVGVAAFLILVVLIPAFAAWVAFRPCRKRIREGERSRPFRYRRPSVVFPYGQWLDSQKTLPFHADEAWSVLWLALAILSLDDEPRLSYKANHPSPLATMHGIAAVPIMLFALTHLANHLMGLWGGQAHIALCRELVVSTATQLLRSSSLVVFYSSSQPGLCWRGEA